MTEILKNACEQFVADRDMLKDIFKWENTYIVHVCAAILGGKADDEKIKYCKKLVKKNKSAFSSFRGNVLMPLVIKLAVSPSPDEELERISAIYDILKKYFYGSEYLVFTSSVLSDMISAEDAADIAARGKQIYKLMSKEHPFLTSSEDNVFAALMAVSGKNEKSLINDMEACYKLLKKSFGDGNTVQTLSHILSLTDGAPKDKSQRVIDIYEAIKNSGRKYGKYYELSVLASLSLTENSIDEIAADIIEADAFLGEQEGYGFWGIDKKTRIMHAAMIVSGMYSDNNGSTAVITGTLAMLAAQQAAMIAAIAASTAATASSSN